MIAEFTIENFFSIKSPQKISFEPSSDNFMSDEYSYEVKDGVRLLKLGIIYGANASGKTNILNAVEFFRMLVLRMPKDRNEKTGVVPFMLLISRSISLLLNWTQNISILRHWLFTIPSVLPNCTVVVMMQLQIPQQ